MDKQRKINDLLYGGKSLLGKDKVDIIHDTGPLRDLSSGAFAEDRLSAHSINRKNIRSGMNKLVDLEVNKQHLGNDLAGEFRRVTLPPTGFANAHSESGSRYAKNFIGSSPLSQFLPHDFRANVSNAIRVHDTDAHTNLPRWAKQFLEGDRGGVGSFFDRSQPVGQVLENTAGNKNLVRGRNIAARALYAGDKLQGFGTGGAFRTAQTGGSRNAGLDDMVDLTAGYGLTQNLGLNRTGPGKYQSVLKNYIPAGPAQDYYKGQLKNYESSLHEMKARQLLPTSEAQLNEWIAKPQYQGPKIVQ